MIVNVDAKSGHVTEIKPQTATQALASYRQRLTCSRYQMMVTLHERGLLNRAKASFDAADDMSRLAWEAGTRFRRTGPMADYLSKGLKITQKDMDTLFEDAMGVEA